MFHVKQGGGRRVTGDARRAPAVRRQRLRDDLDVELAALGLHIGPAVLERCLDYWDMLCSTVSRLNVISRNALSQGPVRHIGDSLAALVHWLPDAPSRLLDVGSGGGLPGIPLTIARPRLETTLLEARERKADWLTSITAKLGLADRITVVTGRVEQQSPEDLQGFDIITARAVAAPVRLLEWVLPGLNAEARLLLWHSDGQREEILNAIDQWRGEATFELKNTLSYKFSTIRFSSNISGVREVH